MADTWIDHHQRGQTIALVASTNEHVDTINHAVQQARLVAGHLNIGVSALIAGGERARVGDVVATRRNDRHLLTSTGEPVRNRETWTVTARAVDGSLTVTQQRGHGTVTLPADYVREHVRLGYAATEHGHQSDTVDTSTSLASSATTRRGLYVAATRGGDENLICVITESTDVAEAREILDGVLAVDRADVPAVAQRRTLAEHMRQGHEPAAPVVAVTARCVIPDWFEPLLAQARTDLAVVEQRQSDRVRDRQRLDDAVVAANRMVQELTAATAPDRHDFSAAEKGVDEARWKHYAAQRRLAASPRRSRRSARHAVDDAARELHRANDFLARTQQRTASSIERYQQAQRMRQDVYDKIHHHGIAEQLDALYDDVGPARRQLDALEIWQRWAHGDKTTVRQLSDAVQVLSAGFDSDHRGHSTLGNAIQTWADATGIDLHSGHE